MASYAKRYSAKVAAMNAAIDSGDSGARKAKRKLADNWTKRNSRNVQGFFDPKKAKV